MNGKASTTKLSPNCSRPMYDVSIEQHVKSSQHTLALRYSNICKVDDLVPRALQQQSLKCRGWMTTGVYHARQSAVAPHRTITFSSIKNQTEKRTPEICSIVCRAESSGTSWLDTWKRKQHKTPSGVVFDSKQSSTLSTWMWTFRMIVLMTNLLMTARTDICKGRAYGMYV